MPNPVTLEMHRKYLFTKIDEVPDKYQERSKRIRVGYSYWYEFPTKSEVEIRNRLMSEFGVNRNTAYEDICVIKILLGDIRNAGKEWIRYQVNAMFDAAYALAEKNEDSKAMSIAAANKAKYNMLHLPDAEPLPYHEIVPQPFEPTDDPSVLGLIPDPDIREKKRKMLEKYRSEIEITDIPYEEMVNENNGDDNGEEGLL